MKICVITSPFCALPPDAIGAVERLWADVASQFAQLGQDVRLIGKRDRTILLSEVNLSRDYVSGFKRTRSVYGDIILDLFYSFRALARMKACDVLVVNTFWGPILAPIFFKRKFRKQIYNVQRFPKPHLKLYRDVDLFVCSSVAVANALKKIEPNFRERVCVVSNPVEIVRMDAVAPNSFTIGYHGRVNAEKGLDILAKAVRILSKEYPELRMKIVGAWDVGNGGSGDAYRAEVDSLASGRVEWIGPVSDRARLARELQSCAIYCYPSVAEKGETFGVSPLEAMALGIPTVVSRLECFGDFVRDGENGLVFDHRSADPVGELVAKLRVLLTNAALRERIGSAAADTAKGFRTEIIARQWIGMFDKCLAD